MNEPIEGLGDLLAAGGAVVGGGAALGAALASLVRSVLEDAGVENVSAPVWARAGGQIGGLAGLAALALRGLGVR